MNKSFITQNLSHLTGFYHYTIHGKYGDGRISVFYVNDFGQDRLFASFAFCSPEDVKIGAFSRLEGRTIALNRFFGLNGEGVKRIIVWNENSVLSDGFSPFDAIKSFIEGIINEKLTITVDVEYDLGEGEVRKKVIESRSFGTIKVPNWLTDPSNIVKVIEKSVSDNQSDKT